MCVLCVVVGGGTRAAEEGCKVPCSLTQAQTIVPGSSSTGRTGEHAIAKGGNMCNVLQPLFCSFSCSHNRRAWPPALAGRTGEHFMKIAKAGNIHNFCHPNSLLTLQVGLGVGLMCVGCVYLCGTGG